MLDIHICMGEQEIIAFFVGCAKGLMFCMFIKLLYTITTR